MDTLTNSWCRKERYDRSLQCHTTAERAQDPHTVGWHRPTCTVQRIALHPPAIYQMFTPIDFEGSRAKKRKRERQREAWDKKMERNGQIEKETDRLGMDRIAVFPDIRPFWKPDTGFLVGYPVGAGYRIFLCLFIVRQSYSNNWNISNLQTRVKMSY